TKACANVGKARVEIVPDKDYILLPLWTQDPPFSSNPKDSPDAGFKPSGEEEKNNAEDLGNEGGNLSPVNADEKDLKERNGREGKKIIYGGNDATALEDLLHTQVSTASSHVSTANLSDDTVYAFLASQPNRSQLVYEDLKQIHEDDIVEMNLKWQLALLSMRTRRFFQKTGRKITINGSDTVGYENSKRTLNVEETSSKAMLAIDGTGFDWSYMADDEVPINMALMAFSYSELEKLKQEKESNQLKIENFDNASKSLDKLIGSQIPDKSRKGLGFVSYNVVLPPPTGLFSPLNLDLSNSGLEEFQQPKFEGYGPKTSKSVSEVISNEVKEIPDAPLVEELVSNDKLEKRIVSPTKIEFVRPKQHEKPVKYAEMYRSQGPTGN
ncbi:hypothetical protein Tco_1158001, partial [Tanacetum coccineum]